jgi:hypothetical protein
LTFRLSPFAAVTGNISDGTLGVMAGNIFISDRLFMDVEGRSRRAMIM